MNNLNLVLGLVVDQSDFFPGMHANECHHTFVDDCGVFSCCLINDVKYVCGFFDLCCWSLIWHYLNSTSPPLIFFSERMRYYCSTSSLYINFSFFAYNRLIAANVVWSLQMPQGDATAVPTPALLYDKPVPFSWDQDIDNVKVRMYLPCVFTI